jgi:hypothetical protein
MSGSDSSESDEEESFLTLMKLEVSLVYLSIRESCVGAVIFRNIFYPTITMLVWSSENLKRIPLVSNNIFLDSREILVL